METKTFLVVLGAIITFVVLGGIWIIANSISEQSKIQYDQQLNRSYNYGNNSVIIHDALYNNITDLKKDLDPILDQIPNATQSKLDQDLHYNNAIIHFDGLEIMNQTINKILEVLNGTAGVNGTIIPVPTPIVVVENATEDPVIENVTDDDRGGDVPIPGPLIVVDNTTTGLSN